MAESLRPLNLFYEEPESDRWFPGDRYPRRIVRRLIRGKPMIGGMKRWFVNLCSGLDRIAQPYRTNRYRRLRSHSSEVACVVGKSCVLNRMTGPNPIIYGPATATHPLDEPDLLERKPQIRKIVVPCEWVRRCFEPYYGDRLTVWPAGIETDLWRPRPDVAPEIDVLLYDKVRWEHDAFRGRLIEPIERELHRRSLSFRTLRYGYYLEDDFCRVLGRVRMMIFLCEHESQGFAYLQALSAGVPIVAWDRGGMWRDPAYYPDRVQFGPITSVPYWDERCGEKFADAEKFPAALDRFLDRLSRGELRPRDYILENLTLEKCAREYLKIVESVAA